MEKRFIMAIDQGTTGTHVALFNHDGQIHASAYREIRQIYQKPGWVEHDPREYWDTTMECAAEVFKKGNTSAAEVAAIGIACQRETTILWDRDTGEPLYYAVVWQSRQSAAICEEMKAKGLEEHVRQHTGLPIDAYFSGTKIRWIIDNVPGVSEKVKAGKVCFGNIDSWLMYKLSGGASHVEDYSNASRTMLLDIKKLKWDERIMEALGISEQMMPQLKPSSGILTMTSRDVFFRRGNTGGR